GRITYLNRAAQELYGVDYLGYDLADHLEKVRALRTDGAPFPLEEMPVGRSLKTGEAVHDVEMVIERADGRRIPVSVSSAPLLDAQGKIQTAIVAFSDIAARKDAEEQLERSNRRIKHILASIQDDFYVLDRDWRFVYASRNFTGRIGKEPKDFVGNVIWEMFPKHLGTPYEENVRAAMERGEVRRFEIEGKYTNSRYMITVFPSAEGITVLGTDITEQKKTEDAARENAERLRFALETSRTGAWELDLVDHTAFRSLDHDRIFGYQELRPQWTYEIFLDHVVPEDREEVNAKFREAIATKGLWNFECRIRRADGEIRWIWAAGRHRLGAAGEARRMVGIVQDITERKRAEVLKQALSEQESLRLGAALEQSPDAVVLFDLDGTIRYVNAAFGSINRVAKDEAKGRSYFETYAASAAASVRKAVSEGRTWQGQLSRRISAGQTVELEVAASAITDPKGGIIGGLATEKDITNELALQRQLRQSQKMEALGTLAGGIAHDFNNILNPIFISMELALLEPSLDLSIRQHLEVALKAAERGRDLVKQVIAFSRQKERERKPTKAGPVVQEAVNFLRASLPSTIEVKSDIRDETGCVMGDPAQIHQIVMNLSGNAAYAMRQKGGVLTVGLDSVEVVKAGQAARMQGLKPGTYLRLTVSDTGTGMTPEVRDHLFDPFFTTKGPGEGSGMGLPVVDGIVRDYGGAIAVDTDEGRGSTFTVYVPRIESQESPRPVPLNSLPRGSGRILLIDDEEAQVYSVRGMLEKLGYKVTAMTKPQEALDLFRADREAFDLVITDQTMPRLTGLQVAEQVLKDRPGTPIVLCTGFSEAVDAKEAHALGIREFLMKPYSVREMAEVVRRTLAADLRG
ncbi:MAG: PAS domain-containing protein, partial [Acidobacteriota bacterium]